MIISLDFETSGHDVRWHPDWKVLGWAWAYRSGSSWDGYSILSHYAAVGHLDSNSDYPEIEYGNLKSLLSEPGNTWVWHNAKHELECLRRLGLPIPEKHYDTMLMAHFLNENLVNKGLDYLGRHYIGEGKAKTEDQDKFTKIDWGLLPRWLAAPYARQDAELTLKLFEKLHPMFVKEGYET